MRGKKKKRGGEEGHLGNVSYSFVRSKNTIRGQDKQNSREDLISWPRFTMSFILKSGTRIKEPLAPEKRSHSSISI